MTRRTRSDRRTRLDVVALEDRTTPVLGGFTPPYVSAPDDPFGVGNLSGVVEYDGANGVGTGVLIDRGSSVVGSRHVLTAASLSPQVGDRVTFDLRQPDGSLRQISIPVIDVFIPPGGGDLAVVTLAAAAPAGVADYPLYTSAQASVLPEVGQPFLMAGYGRTGDGVSGQADLDLQRMTIHGTGGSFFLVLNGTQGTTPLKWNATPAQVQTALLSDFGVASTVTQPPAGTPFAGSYEVLFTAPVQNNDRLGFVSNPADPFVNGTALGTVDFVTLTNGQFDGEFQRLGVTATGGTYRLGLSGGFTAPLPFNATAAQIQAALQTLPGVSEATVTAVTSGPAAGTFQISFDKPSPVNFPQLVVDTTGLTGGSAGVITLQDGGQPALRVGQSVYETQTGNFLTDRFANDGSRTFFSPNGDVGAPGFLDIGGGVLDVASVFSANATGGTTFGAIQDNTRVAPFSNSLQAYMNAFPYTATVDMKYQLAGNDGRPDVIRIRRVGTEVEVLVPDVNGNPVVAYADDASKISSLVVNGSADDDTFVVEGNVGVPVFINGGGGNDTLIGANLASTWTVNGVNQGNVDSINTFFTGIANLTGGSANDTFDFAGPGRITGNLDGGLGFELLDFSASASTAVTLTGPGPLDGLNGVVAGGVPIGGMFLDINAIKGSAAGVSDSLTGFASPGTWTVDVPLGTYTDSGTGQSLLFGNFEVLNGGPANDVFNVRNTTGPLTINAGLGNDVINVASDAPANAGAFGSLGGPLTVNGGGGSDQMFVAGTAGNDAISADLLSAAGDTLITGLPQPIVTSGVAGINLDGGAGTNSFTFADVSGVAWGTPTAPSTGVVFAPSSATSGSVRVGGVVRYGFTNVAAALLNGDANAAGAPDVFMVLGTSAPGQQSAYGEAAVADGQDRVTVTDTAVILASVQAGALLSPALIYNGATPTFSTLYVATGNESGSSGDIVAVTPSKRVNIVVDGMAPNLRKPGDQLIINATGPTTVTSVNNPSLGPPQTRITQTIDGASFGFLDFETAPVAGGTTQVSSGMVVVGSGPGTPARVQVYDRLSGKLRFEVHPFGGFKGGVSVATGDVNGDGVADLIVGVGPGGGPFVSVYSGVDGSLIETFAALSPQFRGGINVAAGDFNGDGIDEIVAGAGPTGGPVVQVIDARTLVPLKTFFAFAPSFRGGVQVALADFNADGVPDFVTTPAANSGPVVRVLDGNTLAEMTTFFAFNPGLRTPISIAAGDVSGDGVPDIVVGSGRGTPAEVRVFSGVGRAQIADFFVNTPFNPDQIPSIRRDAGVRVAVADADGDGIDDIIAAKGPFTLPVLHAYGLGSVNSQTNALFLNLREIRSESVFDSGYGFGIYVGGSD